MRSPAYAARAGVAEVDTQADEVRFVVLVGVDRDKPLRPWLGLPERGARSRERAERDPARIGDPCPLRRGRRVYIPSARHASLEPFRSGRNRGPT
jgi:hypothetical protein